MPLVTSTLDCAVAAGATTVLLVEDEESFIDALVVALAREGYTVEVARDGVEALEAFGRVAPDVVLLDVMLPRLSGLEVCKRLRSQSHVPILLVSAKASEDDIRAGFLAGTDDYIVKPFRLPALLQRIRAVLPHVD